MVTTDFYYTYTEKHGLKEIYSREEGRVWKRKNARIPSAQKDEGTSKWTALTESAMRIEHSVISPFSKYKTAGAFLYFEGRETHGQRLPRTSIARYTGMGKRAQERECRDGDANYTKERRNHEILQFGIITKNQHRPLYRHGKEGTGEGMQGRGCKLHKRTEKSRDTAIWHNKKLVLWTFQMNETHPNQRANNPHTL